MYVFIYGCYNLINDFLGKVNCVTNCCVFHRIIQRILPPMFSLVVSSWFGEVQIAVRQENPIIEFWNRKKFSFYLKTEGCRLFLLCLMSINTEDEAEGARNLGEWGISRPIKSENQLCHFCSRFSCCCPCKAKAKDKVKFHFEVVCTSLAKRFFLSSQGLSQFF